MYNDLYWPALERALADAQNGDGAGLMQLSDAYFRRGPDGATSNLVEAFEAISCADSDERLTVEESDAQAASLVGVAPRVFPATSGSYGCVFFPASADSRIEITGVGAGPIVVLGTAGDPATPLESSRRMAAALEDGRLIVVDANRHTGYQVGGCATELVERYLVTLEAPGRETIC
jgi:hypothetical protein